MGLADLHIHTTYSWDGVSTVSAVLKYTRNWTDLDIIAITDHDEIRGSLEAQQLAPAYGLHITGSEINTAEGHLLALFIEKKIPPGLSLIHTIQRVKDQGGICIAAHPMARGAPSLTSQSIRNALRHPDSAGVFVGIEIFNGGLFHRAANRLAYEMTVDISRHMTIAQLANSDSHVLFTIGQVATEFDGSTPGDLRNAILLGRTRPKIGKISGALSIITGWVPRYLLRSAGWVAWNQNPAEPIRFTHTSKLQPVSLMQQE
jgi:hypothetical protein